MSMSNWCQCQALKHSSQSANPSQRGILLKVNFSSEILISKLVSYAFVCVWRKPVVCRYLVINLFTLPFLSISLHSSVIYLSNTTLLISPGEDGFFGTHKRTRPHSRKLSKFLRQNFVSASDASSQQIFPLIFLSRIKWIFVLNRHVSLTMFHFRWRRSCVESKTWGLNIKASFTGER